jgi:hypothetical protein
MAGGWLTKQADQLTARFLNDVNDSVSGGTIFALPSGVQPPPYSATQPGDRIVLDDPTAIALSDTANVGTLYGGVYMYVGTLSTSTNSPGRGQIAYWNAQQLPPNVVGGTNIGYTATADVNPSASVPTFIAGVFINAPTKGNFCWIQVAGVASVLFDQTLTSQAQGNSVTAKISSNASTPGSADVGISTFGVVTLASLLGVAVSSPVASTISQVIMTRGMFCGRI